MVARHYSISHTTNPCVTRKVGHTTRIPFRTTYGTGVDIPTTIPKRVTTMAWDTTCPAVTEGPCYTIYTTRTIPPYVEIIYDYTAVTSTGYSEGVVYSYSTSCPTSYHSRRSISNGQASVGPGVVGVARSLCIVVSLGLMVCYFPLKRAASKTPSKLRFRDPSNSALARVTIP